MKRAWMALTVTLIACGADMVAAISSVYLAGDPEIAAREFVRLFEQG